MLPQLCSQTFPAQEGWEQRTSPGDGDSSLGDRQCHSPAGRVPCRAAAARNPTGAFLWQPRELGIAFQVKKGF